MHQGWIRTSRLFALAFLPAVASAAPPPPTPASPAGSVVLEKTAITISYNPAFKQANWVFYPLGAEELQDCHDRASSFRPDPEIPRDQSAQLSDYRDSGYDRGHLSPAGDNKWSAEAMSESFLLSNISPQPAKLNRGLWSRLESLVRAWAMRAGGLWVTTGPVLQGGLESIGDGRVAVPEYFYKVLATRDGRSAMAIVLPRDASQSLDRYAMPVDEAERVTRLDFLRGIREETRLEAGLDLSRWDFKAKFQYPECESKRMNQWFRLPAY